MKYAIVLKKVISSDGKEEYLTFPSLTKLRKFFITGWQLQTKSINEIIPKADEVTSSLVIPVEWKDEKWEISFLEKLKSVENKMEKKFSNANFTRLEVKLYHSLPSIIKLLEKEKEREDTAKEFMRKAYSALKGFEPKKENIRVSEIPDVEDCLSSSKEFFSNLERRIEKNSLSA